MAAVSASTTAGALPAGWQDVQNLGAVDVFADYDPAVTTSTGIKITANGGTYSRPPAISNGAILWVRTASSTADLRVTVLPGA